MPLHPWPPSENSLKPTCTPKHIHPSLNHPPGVLRGVRPLLCPWTQNFVDCFLFCCALESSCLGRLSAIKVQLELELELELSYFESNFIEKKGYMSALTQITSQKNCHKLCFPKYII